MRKTTTATKNAPRLIFFNEIQGEMNQNEPNFSQNYSLTLPPKGQCRAPLRTTALPIALTNKKVGSERIKAINKSI